MLVSTICNCGYGQVARLLPFQQQSIGLHFTIFPHKAMAAFVLQHSIKIIIARSYVTVHMQKKILTGLQSNMLANTVRNHLEATSTITTQSPVIPTSQSFV